MTASNQSHDYLPNAVNKLKKDGTSVSIVVLVVSVASTLRKLVAKAQPLLFNQNLVDIRILRRATNVLIASKVHDKQI